MVMIHRLTAEEDRTLCRERFSKLKRGTLCHFWTYRGSGRFPVKRFFLVAEVISNTEVRGVEFTPTTIENLLNQVATGPFVTVPLEEISCLNID